MFGEFILVYIEYVHRFKYTGALVDINPLSSEVYLLKSLTQKLKLIGGDL